MKKISFYTMLLALPLIAACSNDDSDNGSAADEIHFTSQLQATATRGTTTWQETQIASGEHIYVWAEKYSDNSEYFNAWKLVADGNGGFVEPTTKYFPKGNATLNFYAIHYNGDFSENTQTMPNSTTGHSHEVEVNQTSAENFKKSDLLYASMQNQGHIRSAVPLTFYHMLAKVEVALKLDQVFTSSVTMLNASLELMNGTDGLKKKVTFKPVKTTAAAMSENANNLRGNMVATENTPTVDRIGIGLPAITTDFSDFTEAILPPQTISGKFIKLTITNSGSTYYGMELYYTLPQALTLQSGYKYRFNITVSPTVLQGSVTVTEWASGTTTNILFSN